MRRAVSTRERESRSKTGFACGWAQQQQVLETKRRSADQVALQSNAVAIATTDLKDRLDACAGEQYRGRQCSHADMSAGAVRQVDGVDEARERPQRSEQILRIAGERRHRLRGYDETAALSEFIDEIHRLVKIGERPGMERGRQGSDNVEARYCPTIQRSCRRTSLRLG
jgi:hypothetical protein